MVDGSGFDRQQPKKNAGQDQPASQADPVAETVKSINNFFGQLRNDAVASVTGFDAKTLVTKLPPENIASYLRGRDLKDSNASDLSQQQHNDLKVYNALHDNLSAQIPFFDHDAFVKSMEQEIQQRAQNQKHSLGTTFNTSKSGDGIKQDNINALSPGQDQASIHSQAQSLLESSQKALLDEAQAARQADSRNSRSLDGHAIASLPTTEFGSQISTPITWDAVVVQSGTKPSSPEIQLAKLEPSQLPSPISTHTNNAAPTDRLPKPISSEKHLDSPISSSGFAIESKSSARHDEPHSFENDDPQTASAQGLNAKTNKVDSPGPSNLESPRTSASGLTNSSGNTVPSFDSSHAPATGAQSIYTSKEGLQPLPPQENTTKTTKLDCASQSKSASLLANDEITSQVHKAESSNLPPVNPIAAKTSNAQEVKSDISIQATATISQSIDAHPSHQHKHEASEVSGRLSQSSGKADTTMPNKSDSANRSNLSNPTISNQMKSNSSNVHETRPASQNRPNLQSTTSESSNQASVARADARAIRSDSSNAFGNIGIGGHGSSKAIDTTMAKSTSANQSNSDSTRTKSDTHRPNNSDTTRPNHSDPVRTVRWQFSRSPARGQSESSTRPNASAQFVRSGGTVSDRPDGPQKVIPKGIFTTSQYIQDKRYIFGAEIALAAVIAAAGAARLRAEAVKPGPRAELIPADKPREGASQRATVSLLQADNTGKSGPEPERTPISTQIKEDSKPIQSPIEPITARDTTATKQIPKNFVASQQIPEKRFITGTEIALAAIIASVGSSRIRADLIGPRSQASGLPPDSAPTPEPTSLNLTEKHSEQASDENSSNDQPGEESTMNYPGGHDSSIPTQQPTVLPAKNLQSSIEENRYSRTAIRPKILVSATDTLVSIAEAFFHDPNVAWLIADLNSAVLKESWVEGKRIVEMKTRQQIELPVWDDVSEFYKTRSGDRELENLITIVDQSSIDIELLNSTLGKIVDPRKDTPE